MLDNRLAYALIEADPGSDLWNQAVTHGRELVARLDVDRWAIGDLLVSVFPYEDYDQHDPHRRLRHGGGERRIAEFGEAIGLTQQQSTRYWKTSGVWDPVYRRAGVSWSTYCEAATTRFRSPMLTLLEDFDQGGTAPTVDKIRRLGGLSGAGQASRNDVPRRRGNVVRRLDAIRAELQAIAQQFPETLGPLDRVERGLIDMARQVRTEAGR